MIFNEYAIGDIWHPKDDWMDLKPYLQDSNGKALGDTISIANAVSSKDRMGVDVVRLNVQLMSPSRLQSNTHSAVTFPSFDDEVTFRFRRLTLTIEEVNDPLSLTSRRYHKFHVEASIEKAGTYPIPSGFLEKTWKMIEKHLSRAVIEASRRRADGATDVVVAAAMESELCRVGTSATSPAYRKNHTFKDESCKGFWLDEEWSAIDPRDYNPLATISEHKLTKEEEVKEQKTYKAGQGLW